MKIWYVIYLYVILKCVLYFIVLASSPFKLCSVAALALQFLFWCILWVVVFLWLLSQHSRDCSGNLYVTHLQEYLSPSTVPWNFKLHDWNVINAHILRKDKTGRSNLHTNMLSSEATEIYKVTTDRRWVPKMNVNYVVAAGRGKKKSIMWIVKFNGGNSV